MIVHPMRKGTKLVLELGPGETVKRIDHGWLVVHPERQPRIVWDDGRESFVIPMPGGGIAGHINHGESE